MEGFRPIVHTIAPFLTERPFEQLKLDFGYQGLGATFVSVGASYDYATEGGTHHAPGDIEALGAIPGFELLVPGHPAEVDRLMRETYANGSPTYVRTSVSQNREARDVEPGTMQVVRRGSRATLLAVGPMLDRSLVAAEGLDVTMLYATSVAPFDARTLAEVAGARPLVVTIEPLYEGTLAPMIASALAHVPSRIASIGVPRRFLRRYGTPGDYDRELGLDAAGIRARLTGLLEDPRPAT
jgi:transketolase